MFLPRKPYTSVMSLWGLRNRTYVWFSTLEVVIYGAIRQTPLSVSPLWMHVVPPALMTRALPPHIHL